MFKLFKKSNGPSERPLKDNEQREVKDYCRSAAERLGASPAKESPDAVVKKISAYVDDFRETNLDPSDAVDAALELGCLWGFAICRQMKWQWAFVTIEGEGIYSIVSPAREYVIFPMLFMQKLLADTNSDQTSLLIYNVIKAGRLPASQERSYLVLS